MKKLLCVLVAFGVVAFAATVAQASVASSQWFNNEENLLSDNDAEYLINRNGGDSSIADEGDIFIGVANMGTVEDLTGGGGVRQFSTATVDELVVIYALKVSTKVDSMTTPGASDFTFAPLTVADTAAAVAAGQMSAAFKTYLDSWKAGTMLDVWSDPAKDATRVFNATHAGPDDGDTDPPTGVDVGIPVAGTYAAEEMLVRSYYDFVTMPTSATHLLELGFTGLGGVATGNEGVFATLPDDVALDRAVPVPQPAGFYSFGLNETKNDTGLRFDDVDGPIGPVHFSGSASVLGVGRANTPFDVFTNTDVVFAPTPEPASVVAWVLLGATAGLAWRRRRMTA